MPVQDSKMDENATVSDRYARAISLIDTAPADAVVQLEELEKQVSALALFSSNESLEDISTKSLSLLSLDYYLGKAHLSVPTGPGQAADRKSHVDQSVTLFSSFLSQMEQLELLSKEQTRDYHELLNVESSSDDCAAPRTAGQEREAKIARFRAKQEAEKQLSHLKSLQQRRSRLDTEADEELDGYDQESLERQVYLKSLSVHVTEAIEEWYQALRELPMIEMAVKMEQQRSEEERHVGPTKAEEDRKRPISTKPMQLTHITQDALTGQLQVRKEEVRSKVFQPGWNQPTMSLEEFGERERKEAIEREARQKVAEAEQKQAPRRYDQLVKDGLEDNADLVDASAQVDRAWDDFKDENPKGSGNKMGDRGDRNF